MRALHAIKGELPAGWERLTPTLALGPLKTHEASASSSSGRSRLPRCALIAHGNSKSGSQLAQAGRSAA